MTTPPTDQVDITADEEMARIKDHVHRLLALCAENEVDVPDELKFNLLETVEEVAKRGNHTEFLVGKQKERTASVEQSIDAISALMEAYEKVKANPPNFSLRVKNGSYSVTNYYEYPPGNESAGNTSGPRRAKQTIRTVRSESPLFKIASFVKRCVSGNLKAHEERKVIMDHVNVEFEPGRMYLVLGAPGSGKSTFLKMIANTLYQDKNHTVGGEVFIAGVSTKNTCWSNLVGYIDQIDRLHPYLTVQETCEFAWKCRSGGTHRRSFFGEGADVDAAIAKMDAELAAVHKILEILGLTRVKDTFVGDQSTVRGVSGGEKKRVTVAEMLVSACPVLCCDEISTGLDAATTFDITRTLAAATRITETIKIVSLLQPPPETVANFDDLILLAEGKVIYFGPVEIVVHYFKSLGYGIPDRMDVADWLQALPAKDGWKFLDGASPDDKKGPSKHMTAEQFRQRFNESILGRSLFENVNSAPTEEGAEMIKDLGRTRYQNSAYKSLRIVAGRELLLWWRDKGALKAKLAQDLVMGVIVGTIFFQQDAPQNILGVLFQSMFFSCVGAMATIVGQYPARSIFYKHQDANFFPTWSYIVGRSVATIPFAILDALVYGSLIYFLVGLSINDGASVGSYFLFMAVLFTVSWASGLFFSMYSAAIQTITTAQSAMAVTAIMFVLFSGFTVQPDVIPPYFIWIYWLNYFSWTFRGLVVNEFDSGKYDEIVQTDFVTGEMITEGNAILGRFGFVDEDDVPYTFEWAGWSVLFALGSALLACVGSVYFLSNVRFSTGQALAMDMVGEDNDELDDGKEGTRDESTPQVQIPFTRVDLTFKDVRYTVKSSITREQLELLKGIDGVVQAGKMTALMGSSGAGKTTLMDVLAMRKSSGEIAGEIRLNGHPQEEMSFRRCAGYVEQFDSQTPELTIRETCDFSAKLRLDENDPAVTPGSIRKFVDQTLAMLDLETIQDLQVGSDDTGGLSFEQRKRLSIAVELVANPSVLFLDEPTSGLDSSASTKVMRGLKLIAESGRAVCATIHQPSIAIFNEFDELLLLQRGGEPIFFGETGENSSKLIDYLERYDATPRIQAGENPATWMLTTIGAGSSTSAKKPFDYAGSYAQSKLRRLCLDRIGRTCNGIGGEKVHFASEFATSSMTQSSTVFFRAFKVYFRSPSYNVTRVLVAAIVATLFGSVYASQRVPENESDMNSRINSIFMAVLFLCVSSQNSVLKVFETERNMFYRHTAARMYGSRSLLMAFTISEIPFIVVQSTVFSVLFYFIMGFAQTVGKFFMFWMFVTLAFATFTFLGQMLISLFKDASTAQGFGGLLVSVTSLFAGILIRPDSIPQFWVFMYWITPGHYRVASSFPDFSVENNLWDALYLVLLVATSRVVAFIALTNLNYRAT